MRILLYEHLAACGLGSDPSDPLHSMYREGLAMREAVAEDLGRIPGIEVVSAPPAEASIVIAPESDGVLLGLLGNLPNPIAPSLEAVRLTSDKLALANHWAANGVLTPPTSEGLPCGAFPMVWKPRDGCGSTDTFLLESQADRVGILPSGSMIAQRFVPGRAASVAFLCGPGNFVPLVPCFQHLSIDGRFHYLGGELPIPGPMAERAIALAARAVECVPGLAGYVGVDLVLGGAADGSADYAIEINPRFTTSYVGLRAFAQGNLAEALLRIARGEKNVPMRWKRGGIRFSSGGTVLPVGQA